MTSRHWLLFTYQLPSRPSNARVQTWRRLQEIGAAPTGTSAYVLPDREQCRADFDWLRREVVRLGGRALVFSAEPTDSRDATNMIGAFKRLREEDYRALRARARKLSASSRSRAATRPTPARRRAIVALRERFDAVTRIDYFESAGSDAAEAAIAALERLGTGREIARSGRDRPRMDFRNRRWVTRPRPSIDRISSAWLIRRFIDPEATFEFTHEPGPRDVPFDIPGIGFTHRNGMCTFESLVETFAIDDPVVQRLSRIVHDLDLKDARYGLPETASIGHVIDGLRGLYADDHALLEHGINFFDVFAGSRQSEGLIS